MGLGRGVVGGDFGGDIFGGQIWGLVEGYEIRLNWGSILGENLGADI